LLKRLPTILNITMSCKTDFSSQMYNAIQKHGADKLYKNIRTDVSCIDFSSKKIITTTTTDIYAGNCYVVSPFAMIINYSQEELYKVKQKVLLPIAWLLISVFSVILKVTRIDRIHILNNQMLSTNFFETYWNDLDFKEITIKQKRQFPKHALAIRSLNEVQNETITKKLHEQNWIPIVTRQVYLFEKYDMHKRDIIRDMKLLQSSRYKFVEPDPNSLEYFQKAEGLYNQLYLKKYTPENIQYTALYMQEMYRSGDLHLRLLLDTEANVLVGVVGIIGNNVALTAPIVGYELSRPASEALYRRCLIYIINYAASKQITLNLSSGAPDFKRNRGAQPAIEYVYVYVKHLPMLLGITWWVLSKISLYFYRPILIREKL